MNTSSERVAPPPRGREIDAGVPGIIADLSNEAEFPPTVWHRGNPTALAVGGGQLYATVFDRYRLRELLGEEIDADDQFHRATAIHFDNVY